MIKKTKKGAFEIEAFLRVVLLIIFFMLAGTAIWLLVRSILFD